MPDVTKPVVLDETGRQIHPKLDAMTTDISTGLETLVNAIGSTIEPFRSAVDQIIEAMDRLDIIYYVEN